MTFYDMIIRNDTTKEIQRLSGTMITNHFLISMFL